MTAARCSGGIATDSERSAPRNATPKPPPPITAPTQYRAAESEAADNTISTMPADRANDPYAAPAHGAVRPNSSCAAAPDPARAKIPNPVTRWFDVSNRDADRDGPSD